VWICWRFEPAGRQGIGDLADNRNCDETRDHEAYEHNLQQRKKRRYQATMNFAEPTVISGVTLKG